MGVAKCLCGNVFLAFRPRVQRVFVGGYLLGIWGKAQQLPTALIKFYSLASILVSICGAEINSSVYICGSNEIMKTFDVRYINHPSICTEEEEGDRVAGAYNWGNKRII